MPSKRSVTASFLATAALCCVASSSWQDSSDGVHPFIVFDDHVDPQDTRNISFVWAATKPAWSQTHAVTSHYIAMVDAQPVEYWQRVKPEWILYRCDRVTPAFYSTSPDAPLDFSNPDVVTYMATNRTAGATTNAIAVDMMYLYNAGQACGVWSSDGQWVPKFTGSTWDDAFTDAVLSFAEQFGAQVREQGFLFVGNICRAGDPWYGDKTARLIRAIDAFLCESGFSGAGTGLLTDDDWVSRVETAYKLQQEGKAFFPVNEWGGEPDCMTVQYLLASYYMSNLGSTGVYITQLGHYGFPNWWPQYDMYIGAPVDSRMHLIAEQEPWQRRFAHGIVLVNHHANTTATIKMSAGGKDVCGNAFEAGKTYTLTPATAHIVVRA